MDRRERAGGDRHRRVGALLLALTAVFGSTGLSTGADSTASSIRSGLGAMASGVAGWSVGTAAGASAPSSAVGSDVRASSVGRASASVGLPHSQTAGTFTFDLYRSGVFTTQATWWYCTAASVQIMRNIDRRESDHSAAAQTRYFTYMRAHNLHRMPATDGIDPPGFLAGLRAFVDPRYRLVASTTFDNAVRSAVLRLRESRKPVALIVDRGRHAWVLTGFTATADPAATRGFRVLSVRIVGPLYGRQSRNGYDPKPDTTLSLATFRRFLNGYDFKYGPTPWDDRFVTFQVVV